MTDRTISLDGEVFGRIPYGSETYEDGKGQLFSRPCHICCTAPKTPHAAGCPMGPGVHDWLPECRDCGVPLGTVHVVGCGIETCPKCGNQFASCDCEIDEEDDDAGGP